MEVRFETLSNADLIEIVCGPAAKALASLPLCELMGMTAAHGHEKAAGEDRGAYQVFPQLAAARELHLRALSENLRERDCLSSPDAVRSYLCLRLGVAEHESFWCLWLDARNRLLTAEEMFRGTLTQTSIYPREVVKRALRLNAAAVVVAHNHPSGDPQPSRADEMITASLKSALHLVDVRLLDHLIIAGNKTCSFAERGLL